MKPIFRSSNLFIIFRIAVILLSIKPLHRFFTSTSIAALIIPQIQYHTPASNYKPPRKTKMLTSLLEDSPSSPRPPLSPLPISSNGVSRPLTPSPTSKGAPLPRIIRRKPSLGAFHPYLDSSESIPSAHSSLYDASLQTSSLDDAAAAGRTWDVPPSAMTVTTSLARGRSFPYSASSNSNDENTPSPRSSWADIFLSTPPRNNTLHTPHVLAPITERPSNTTLRPSHSSRRKASLSLPTPHTPLSTSSTRTFPPFPIPPRSPHRPFLSLDELKALANAPASSPHLLPRPPPPRIPTPPGLPTFNSPAAVSYRLPAPPMRRRDHFRRATSPLLEWRAQTAGLPKGVVMRGDGGVLVRGRFKWHGGGEVKLPSRHPWNQRTDANADADGTVGYVDRLRWSARQVQQRDRATVARQQERCDSRIGGRPMSRIGQEGNSSSGKTRSSSRREGKSSASIWDRVWERGCWVCCGAEEGEEEEGGGNPSNVIIMDAVGLEGVGRVGGVATRG